MSQILTDDHDASNAGGTVMQKARKKVLNWWREQLKEYGPDIAIGESVEESFGDGLAILALLHKLDASAVDLDEAKQRARVGGTDGRRENLELAFELARTLLKIVPLLDAADIVAADANARPDEQCYLTYVSEFPAAFLASYDAVAAAARRQRFAVFFLGSCLFFL